MHLSILIPVYNAEKHIINCLESVSKQGISEENYEVILVNDGSTDGSGEIIEDFIAGKPNMVLENQKNQGNAATRNRLFDLAKGEYVYCLDADDYLVPNTLSGILYFALSNHLDFIGFESRETSISNEDRIPSKLDLPEIKIASGASFLRENTLPKVEVWWYFAKRELLRDFAIKMDDLIMADVSFTYKLVLASQRMAILPIHAHWYFQSPVSIMRTSDNIAAHKLRLADATYAMLLGFNDLIQNPNKYHLMVDSTAMGDLVQKRDYYAFFMILKYLRFEKDRDKIINVVNTFEQRKMYPIKSTIPIHGSPSLVVKIMNVCLNKKWILSLLITLASRMNKKK
ncbi:glycosyltransferase family 2 protein [Maribacter flavus]|uniref:Glycosyltransferase family 2 protein n=1 Tax=Maribacter flavus TaxID=1658664 RepID=A0A5B2TUT9_9FLAO|nr:glycosyltransferase family A protein [Maribacter flavus]KAA2217470.1 glycosyltransferase family 2 protein [Maribacter flavus]